MDKMEYCVVIKFFVLIDLSPMEIHTVSKGLKESAPSFSTVKKWTTEFKRGHAFLEVTQMSHV